MALSDLSDEQRQLLPAYYAGGLLPDVEFEITRLLCRPAIYGLYGENASREDTAEAVADTAISGKGDPTGLVDLFSDTEELT